MKAAIQPGHVDALCLNCRPNGGQLVTLPEGTTACPRCGLEVHPLSLPNVPTDYRKGVEFTPADDDDEPRAPLVRITPKPIEAAERPAPAKVIALPKIKEASVWDRATDALLEALEREEREAIAELDAVRARAREARTTANAVRQLRGLVTVPDTAPTMAKPGGNGAPTGTPWSRKHDRCVNCGTTAVRHASKGRCSTCDKHWRDHHVERPASFFRPS